ncbi:MAG: hypothetical protein ACOZQL_05370 [Myxococcota bacterium]
MRTIRGWLVATAVLASACEGVIGSLPGEQPAGGGSGGGGGYHPPTLSCDLADYPNVRLEEAIGVFANDVYPALASGPSQCASCHAVGSGRRFTMTSDATETFHLARGAGFFRDEPGALLSRVTNPDDRVRMPVGAPALADDVVKALDRTVCMVRAYEMNGGVAADEQFPPELLMPYQGPAITSYDNPFINYVQLKAKVKAVFADDWVRSSVDQFERNIGLFGGVNFSTHFVEARAATPDFLLGLDALAPDVCGAAAANGTGPFTGLTITAPVIDVPAQATTTVQIETLTPNPATGAGQASTNPAGYFCYTNCTFAVPFTVPAPGTYRVTVRGKPTLDGDGVGPQLRIQIGSVTGPTTLEYSNAAAYEDKSVDIVLTDVGNSPVSINFFNDAVVNGGDRNIYLDFVTITGPLGAGTGTTRADAAKQTLSRLYERLLYRPASATEQTKALALLTDLAGLGTLQSAWSGVCEALVRHPDFLFTMPPSAETASSATEKDRARLVALTQRALGRPPTAAEFTKLGTDGFGALIEDVFASPDFRAYYFNRIQLRIESQGTTESDEPARLWTYITTSGRSFEEVLTAEYTVDPQYQQQPRPAQHGRSGVLTTRGYLSNKPGLPHYNFPARVFSGFMGSVFEVPPEVFDQRGASTAASTVDPTSICYSCHQLLTPLAHQRLKWADDGTFRETLDGAAIDDSDRGLVATYPYKGAGLESFAVKAVKKEAFVRRMINTQVRLLIGRELRAQTDERVFYKQLWDTTFANNGDMRAVLKAVAASQTFQGAP